MSKPTHGSPEDRGSADAYYGRPFSPHYFPEGSYHGPRITKLTAEQLADYTRGYNEETERKDWSSG